MFWIDPTSFKTSKMATKISNFEWLLYSIISKIPDLLLKMFPWMELQEAIPAQTGKLEPVSWFKISVFPVPASPTINVVEDDMANNNPAVINSRKKMQRTTIIISLPWELEHWFDNIQFRYDAKEEEAYVKKSCHTRDLVVPMTQVRN